jgi:hypothetical protein
MNDSVDLGAVRDVQQKTWSEGDFAMVAGMVMMVSEELAEALDIVPARVRRRLRQRQRRARGCAARLGQYGRRRFRPRAA